MWPELPISTRRSAAGAACHGPARREGPLRRRRGGLRAGRRRLRRARRAALRRRQPLFQGPRGPGGLPAARGEHVLPGGGGPRHPRERRHRGRGDGQPALALLGPRGELLPRALRCGARPADPRRRPRGLLPRRRRLRGQLGLRVEPLRLHRGGRGLLRRLPGPAVGPHGQLGGSDLPLHPPAAHREALPHRPLHAGAVRAGLRHPPVRHGALLGVDPHGPDALRVLHRPRAHGGAPRGGPS
mmetsp:Transcript_114920/g.349665  ORF Transcript_114920/g.349665 Transcript_114920/m.349665 type:complete len:242 (+) Transcript_114920:1-726(+)